MTPGERAFAELYAHSDRTREGVTLRFVHPSRCACGASWQRFEVLSWKPGAHGHLWEQCRECHHLRYADAGGNQVLHPPAVPVAPDVRLVFRDYEIERWTKPIPTRAHDWDFQHRDYDGPGDPRCGSAPSVLACIHEINEQIAEQARRQKYVETIAGLAPRKTQKFVRALRAAWGL